MKDLRTRADVSASLERAVARACAMLRPLHDAEPNLGIVVLVVDASTEHLGYPVAAGSNLTDTSRDGIAVTYARRVMSRDENDGVRTVSIRAALRGAR